MRIEKQLWFWLAALALVVLTIALLRDILLPFVAAIVIAYFLNPLADRLEARGLTAHLGGDRSSSAWSPCWSALALVLLVPVLVDQVRQLVAALPGETRTAEDGVSRAWAHYWLGPNFPAFKTALDRALDRDLAELGGDGRQPSWPRCGAAVWRW